MSNTITHPALSHPMGEGDRSGCCSTRSTRSFASQITFMKSPLPRKSLTFGDLVADIYTNSTRRRAKALVRFAVNTNIVVFRGPQLFVIAEAEAP